MKTVVERRTETKVLENCAKTLIVLCSEDHAIYSRCDVIRSTLFDYLDRRLRDVLKEPVTAGVSLRTYYFFLVYRNKLKHIYIFFLQDEDQVFALVSSLEKVAIFSSCHNLGPWKLWDPLFNAVREANDPSRSLPPEVTYYSPVYFHAIIHAQCFRP
jgi:cohesin complex subunit SA-1/2